MIEVCPLCGDSMDPVVGEKHNWMRVVYRVDGGPWMAVHDGKLVIPQPPCRVTIQRPGASRIRHVFVAAVPEVELVIEPRGAIQYGTAHSSCAQPLVDAANAAEPVS